MSSTTIAIDFFPKTDNDHRSCLSDKGWRMNNHYTITDPGGRKVRFHQKEVQRRSFLEQHGCDVYLKSRQHGITTEKCIEYLDDCMHMPNLVCGIIAHTQIAAQEIFASKIRSVYEDLPKWIKNNNKAVELDKTHIKFENGSSIRVATSFQSATIHRLHVSEHGPLCAKFPARAAQLKGDTLPACHPQEGAKISFESTAEGPAGDFYELCMKAQAATRKSDLTGHPLNVLDYKFHFYAWFEDPKNRVDPTNVVISDALKRYFKELKAVHGIDLDDGQRAWYSFVRDGANGLGKKMKRQHPSTIDEAFEQSVDGAVYPEEMLDLHDKGRIGDFPWVKRYPVFTFWDLGISKGNACCIVFVQFIKDTIRIIDYYECEGRGGTFHTSQMLAKPYTWPVSEPSVYLPHDGRNRDKWTATPFRDSMEDLGLVIETTPRPENKDLDGIQAVRDIFPKLRINFMPPDEDRQPGEPYNGTDRLVKGLSFYRWSWDEDKKMWSKTPIHDWASNPSDCVQTLALGYKHCTINGEYIGDDQMTAAYHELQKGTNQGVVVVDPLSWI